MKYKNHNIKIAGMSVVVPFERIDNITDYDNTRYQRLWKMTGIYHRHMLDPARIKLVDMSIAAAKDIINKGCIDVDRIKFLVYITQHPEFSAPSTAFFLQKELKLNNDCMVFDVNLGCSGFVAGMQILSSMLSHAEDGNLGLLINAEYLSNVERENINDKYLFGDAASATLLEKNTAFDNQYISDYYSDGTRYKAIFLESPQHKCVMDGQAVFEFSTYEVSRCIKHFLEDNEISNDDIDHIAFHQAQKFIIDHMCTNAKLDKQKMLYSLDEYANTSGASIPLSICRNREQLKEHGKFLLSGFGVGLAWGIVYIEIDKKSIYGVIEM